MGVVDEGSLALVALTSRLTDAGVPPLKAAEVWRLMARVDDASLLLGLDERAAAELTSGTGVDPARLVRLLDLGVGLALRLEALYDRGIAPITFLDDHYPSRLRARLGTAAPPVLYGAGEPSLVDVDGVGVVGSRQVGPEAVEVTRTVGQLVAGAGLPLVSGGARGVDSIGMAAAFDAGGGVVAVLADSLERAAARADHRRAMLDGRGCLLTPYRPDAGFTAGAAMGRNKIIYALSRVTLVVASAHGEGGTWSGATEALRKGYGRVAVWTGKGGGPGNAALIDAGATPVDSPEALFRLEPAGPPGAPGGGQMALSFDTDDTARDGGV